MSLVLRMIARNISTLTEILKTLKDVLNEFNVDLTRTTDGVVALSFAGTEVTEKSIDNHRKID